MGAIAVPSAAGTGDLAISASTPSKLMGWTFVESAGTPALATAVLRDGTDVNGPVVAIMGLLASTSGWAWFGPQGIICHNGIFLDRLTGTSTIVVYIQ